MRVLEPFFNANYDESYTRLKNRTKEILAQQVCLMNVLNMKQKNVWIVKYRSILHPFFHKLILTIIQIGPYTR